MLSTYNFPSFLPLLFLFMGYLTPCQERKASGLWPLVFIYAAIYWIAESSPAPEILIGSTRWIILYISFNPHPRIMCLTQGSICLLILDRGREREEHQCERETLIGCPHYALLQGIKPSTQVCAFTRNRTQNLLVYRMGTTLQPTDLPSQGWMNDITIH